MMTETACRRSPGYFHHRCNRPDATRRGISNRVPSKASAVPNLSPKDGGEQCRNTQHQPKCLRNSPHGRRYTRMASTPRHPIDPTPPQCRSTSTRDRVRQYTTAYPDAFKSRLVRYIASDHTGDPLESVIAWKICLSADCSRPTATSAWTSTGGVDPALLPSPAACGWTCITLPYGTGSWLTGTTSERPPGSRSCQISYCSTHVKCIQNLTHPPGQ